MHGINDLWPCHLGNFANNSAVIKAIVEVRGIFERVEWLLDSSWDGFCCFLGIRETYILYDGINEGTLCEFIGAIIMLLNVDTNIVCWMPLILYVQTNTLKFLYDVEVLVLRFSLDIPSSTYKMKITDPQ